MASDNDPNANPQPLPPLEEVPIIIPLDQGNLVPDPTIPIPPPTHAPLTPITLPQQGGQLLDPMSFLRARAKGQNPDPKGVYLGPRPQLSSRRPQQHHHQPRVSFRGQRYGRQEDNHQVRPWTVTSRQQGSRSPSPSSDESATRYSTRVRSKTGGRDRGREERRGRREIEEDSDSVVEMLRQIGEETRERGNRKGGEKEKRGDRRREDRQYEKRHSSSSSASSSGSEGRRRREEEKKRDREFEEIKRQVRE